MYRVAFGFEVHFHIVYFRRRWVVVFARQLGRVPEQSEEADFIAGLSKSSSDWKVVAHYNGFVAPHNSIWSFG